MCFSQDSGTAAQSVTTNLLSTLDENLSEVEVMASEMVPGTMYLAGTDTVSQVHRR